MYRPLANNASLILDVTCTEEEFTCANGNCIRKRWKCDEDYDCGSGDQSDEEGCPGKTYNYYSMFLMSKNVQAE